MLVDTSVPSLVNGVSQQAENFRFPSQCEEQINGFSSVLRGLLKRPHTKHVAPLTLADDNFSAWPVVRSASERYMLVLGDQSLRVFGLDGVEKTVKNASGDPISSSDLAYLHTSTPTTSLYPLTVADYTILLNRDKVTALSSTVTPALWPSALVFVKQFRLGATYTIKLYNDPTSSTPDTTVTNTVTDANGNQGNITADLRAAIAASAANTLYDHFHSDSVLFITKKDESDFRIEIECSVPEGMAVFKDVAQDFAQLPKKGWVGFSLKIKGDPEDAGDDYYVKFVPQDPHAEGFAEGTWEESQGFGLQDQFDVTTLPHALENHGTYFVFKPLSWSSRLCGDTATNPQPSFVGKQIRDVFFHKNRLGFLADENTILSEASEFFNFWRTTVIQLLDSDPIDVGGSHTKVSILNTAVPTSKKLVLFSEQTQFLLESGDTLTPKTVSLPVVSEYENIPSVRPVSLGKSVIFPFKRGEFSGFYEYAVETDTQLFTGFDITEHCPSYLSGTVTEFDLSTTGNILLARTDAAADTLFVYQFFKRNEDRLQSAWHKWQFRGATILSFFVIGTVLYLVLKRGGSYFLESLETDVGVLDSHSEFTTRLDRRIDDSAVTITHDAILDVTTFTMPYTPLASSARVFVRSTADVDGGAQVPLTLQAGTTLKANGDWTTTPLWFGENYAMTTTLTRPLMRDMQRDGTPVIVPGRFQVRRGLIAFNDSLAFRVEVTPSGRDTKTYVFSPRSLGTLTALTGSPPKPQDGVFPFAVYSKNDQVTIRLVNDTALPCALLSIDWEALYTVRAQKA